MQTSKNPRENLKNLFPEVLGRGVGANLEKSSRRPKKPLKKKQQVLGIYKSVRK